MARKHPVTPVQSVSPLPPASPASACQPPIHARLGGALVFLILASFAVAGVLYTEDNKPLDPHGQTPLATASNNLAFLMKYPKATAAQQYAIVGAKGVKPQELLAFSIKGGNSEPVTLKSAGIQITKTPGTGQADTPDDPACGFVSFNLTADEDKQTYLGGDFANTTPAPGSPYATIKPEPYSDAVIAPKTVRHFSVKALVPVGPWTKLSDEEAATALHGCTINAQILPQNIEVTGKTSGVTQTLTGKPVNGPKVTLLAGAPYILPYLTGLPPGNGFNQENQILSYVKVQNLTPATSTLTLKNLPIKISAKKAQPSTGLKIFQYKQPNWDVVANVKLGIKSWSKQKDSNYLTKFSNADKTTDIILAPAATTTLIIAFDNPQINGEICTTIDYPQLEWYLGDNSNAVQKGMPPIFDLPNASGCTFYQPSTLAQPVIKKMELQMAGNKTIIQNNSAALQVKGSYIDIPKYAVSNKFDSRVLVKLTVENATAETEYGFAVAPDQMFGMYSEYIYDYSVPNPYPKEYPKIDSPFTTLVKNKMTWGTKNTFEFEASSPFFTVFAAVKNGDSVYYKNFPINQLDDATGITFAQSTTTASASNKQPIITKMFVLVQKPAPETAESLAKGNLSIAPTPKIMVQKPLAPFLVKLTVENAAKDTEYGYFVLYNDDYYLNTESPGPDFTSKVLDNITWTKKGALTITPTDNIMAIYGFTRNSDDKFNGFPKYKIDDFARIGIQFATSTDMGSLPPSTPASSTPLAPAPSGAASPQ